jgi:hypothetical protein
MATPLAPASIGEGPVSRPKVDHLYAPGGGGPGSDDPPPADHPQRVYGWTMERISEGEAINRADPSYGRCDDLVADLMGDQTTGRHTDPQHKVVINQTKKAINTHASLLTDIRPLWEWRTENQLFKSHAAIMNDLLLTWWVQTFADLEVADAVRISSTIGSSDVLFEYDPNYNAGGDMRLVPRDWRDTIPIRPERSRSLQDWEGIVFREEHAPAKLRSLYPGRLDYSVSATGKLEGVFTKVRRLIRPEGPVTTLSGLGAKDPNKRYTAVATQPGMILYRAFVRDRSINKMPHRVLMGPPGRNWSYFVEPGKPLYPRGRCIVLVEGDPQQAPLFDGPNPYWHGRWPASRLSLQRWPWLMVGMPLAWDVRHLQSVLNITINDFLQVFAQWVKRGSIWGKNAPESLFQRFDTSKPGWKVKVNTLVGTGFQLQDGPTLPSWAMNFLLLLFGKFDEMTGVANLTQLLQLRQAPGRDTLEKYLEAMTPEIRLEARQLECFLRETADMFLPSTAQFYSRTMRKLKLGPSGEVLEDLDYDPNTMIPAMKPGDKDYTPELDFELPRDQRAMWYIKQFAFWVAPSSLLALHAMERQMKYLQLSRQGYMDFWSLGEILEIPNIGAPPPVLLPRALKEGEDPASLPINPETGQPQLPMEVRIPQTVTERLMAQAQLGIGQSVSPVGRKASGQQPPQLKQRPDGSTTVTESG